MHIERPWGRERPLDEYGSGAPVRRARAIFLVATDRRFRIGEPILAILIAQVLLAELAGGRVRQDLDELDRVGKPPFGDFPRQMVADLAFADLALVIADDQQ